MNPESTSAEEPRTPIQLVVDQEELGKIRVLKKHANVPIPIDLLGLMFEECNDDEAGEDFKHLVSSLLPDSVEEVSRTDIAGKTLLQWLVEYDADVHIKILLDAGVDATATGQKQSLPPIELAINTNRQKSLAAFQLHRENSRSQTPGNQEPQNLATPQEMLQQMYSLIREEQGESNEKFKKLLFDSIDKSEVRKSVEDAQSRKKATLLEWALTWGKLDHATLLRKFWDDEDLRVAVDWDRVMEGAAKEGFLGVFHLIKKELGEVRWDFCNGEDKTLLYFLLNGSETNESKERRRDFLAWLMQPEQRHISDQLAKVVTKTDSAGISVLALACKMAGEADQLLDDETKPTRDNVIEWLLGLGADITNVPFTHAKDF